MKHPRSGGRPGPAAIAVLARAAKSLGVNWRREGERQALNAASEWRHRHRGEVTLWSLPIAPGMKANLWAYNGRSPGPTIERVEGDKVPMFASTRTCPRFVSARGRSSAPEGAFGPLDSGPTSKA